MIIASGVVIWGKDKMDVEKELNGTWLCYNMENSHG
jgi:hypothetical protein